MSNMDQIITTDILINGETRPATGGAVYDLYNPARPSELVGHAAAATRADMNDAVAAAHAAFPAWAALGFEARIAKLRAIAAALSADEDDIRYRSRLFTRETRQDRPRNAAGDVAAWGPVLAGGGLWRADDGR